MIRNRKARHDFQWAQRFILDVKRIVGPLLLTEAPLEVDKSQATDLLVMAARDMRIGVRIRRPGYVHKFPDDFTLRLKRDSGARTELEKIKAGWGDWLFYGHATEDDELGPWMVVDLHQVRNLWIDHGIPLEDSRCRWCGRAPNGDGTYLAWFNVALLPRDVVVERFFPKVSRRRPLRNDQQELDFI